MNNDTIQLSNKDILEIYNSSSDEVKKLIESKIGGADKLTLRVEDRIHSVEDACKENGTPIEEVILFPNPKNAKQRCINAFAAKIEIVQALNEQKIPDWQNSNQRKWRSWYYLNGSSGSGLSLHGVYCDFSDTSVASRLCTLKEEHSKLIYERFPEMEADLMTQKSN